MKTPPADLSKYTQQVMPWSGLKPTTLRKFDVTVEVEGETPRQVIIPWADNGHMIRLWDVKKYYNHFVDPINESKLFGQNKFNAGSSRTLTICEGAKDAMSSWQIMGDYPVVAVQSASTARSQVAANIDWVLSFEEIKLAFDNDVAGQQATKAVASMLPPGRVKVVPITTVKDVNEYIETGRMKEYEAAWWNSQPFGRDDIISSFDDIEKVFNSASTKESVPYPWTQLNEMSGGIRTGEVVLLAAPEGIGKTEIVRGIMNHLLEVTPDDVSMGAIFLEEEQLRTVQGVANFALKKPVHRPEYKISQKEAFEAYKSVVRKNGRLHVYTSRDNDDPDNILDSIRFMVTGLGCKYVFFDHIHMTVTGGTDDQTKALDYLSTKLATLTRELDFGLIMVSHVNDDGQTRGSRNIAKIAHLRVQLSRDLLNENPLERNTTKLVVQKNRYGAVTGPAGGLLFDPETFLLTEIEHEETPF